MKYYRLMVCVALVASLILFSCRYGTFGTKGNPDARWEKIKVYFNPPGELKNDFGSYRSPLKFYDGKTVKTPEDWTLRRQEILDKWHEMMGKWPALIENPKVEIVETVQRENFTQHSIKLEWRRGEMTKGYLLIPVESDRKAKKPAVITVFYEPETAIGLKGEFRDFAYQLAKRGFVTLSLGTSATKESSPYGQYYPTADDAVVEPLSMLAYLAANAYNFLAGHPEVNPEKIGITGHSYGGKWSMLSSCLYDKFACAAWSDGGIVFDESRPNVNYWEPWYLGYHKKPWRKGGVITPDNPAKGLYPWLVEEGFDLHELHALMAPRPFLVSGGSEDPVERWIPLNHTVAVNKLLGYENRVAMTNRPTHSPNFESNEVLYNFFEYFLKGKSEQ